MIKKDDCFVFGQHKSAEFLSGPRPVVTFGSTDHDAWFPLSISVSVAKLECPTNTAYKYVVLAGKIISLTLP